MLTMREPSVPVKYEQDAKKVIDFERNFPARSFGRDDQVRAWHPWSLCRRPLHLLAALCKVCSESYMLAMASPSLYMLRRGLVCQSRMREIERDRESMTACISALNQLHFVYESKNSLHPES